MYWLTILYGKKFDGTLYMHLHQTGEHACRLKTRLILLNNLYMAPKTYMHFLHERV